MCEFKKGDKVICISTDNHPELIKDKIYEVEKPNGDFVYLKGCKYGYFTFLFRKECEYCKKNRSIGTNEPLGVYIHYPNRLIVRGVDKKGWDISIDTKINYCPMCGRKLGEEK